jgi:chromosome segregation ATPase
MFFPSNKCKSKIEIKNKERNFEVANKETQIKEKKEEKKKGKRGKKERKKERKEESKEERTEKRKKIEKKINVLKKQIKREKENLTSTPWTMPTPTLKFSKT